MEEDTETLCRSCKFSFEVSYLEDKNNDIDCHIFCCKTPTLIKFDAGKIVVNCTGYQAKKK